MRRIDPDHIDDAHRMVKLQFVEKSPIHACRIAVGVQENDRQGRTVHGTVQFAASGDIAPHNDLRIVKPGTRPTPSRA